MTDFNPYYRWLGIPPEEQPPNHYRLLGVALFEGNLDVIETAADRQMAHVRTFQTGPRSALSQQLLNEIAAAKVCLLNPKKRSDYDAQLRQRLERDETPANPRRATARELEAAGDAVPLPSGPEIAIQGGKAERIRRTRPAWRNPAILVSAGSILLLAVVTAIAATMFTRGSATEPPSDPGPVAGVSPKPEEPLKSDSRPSPNPQNRAPAESPTSSGDNRTRALAARIEAAAGMFTDEFALCQTMSYADFQQVVEQLRPLGYRPIRCRPYVTEQGVKAAAVWLRDEHPWTIEYAGSAEDIKQREPRSQGYLPIDVAGFAENTDQYVAIWAQVPGAPRAELVAGLSDEALGDAVAPLRPQGFIAATRQTFVGIDDTPLNNMVWIQQESKTAWRYWRGDRIYHQRELEAAGFLLDIDVSAGKNDVPIFASCRVGWKQRRSQEVHGLTPESQLDQFRDLAAQGFRPAALSVAPMSGDKRLEAASVWHWPEGRPLADPAPAIGGRSPAGNSGGIAGSAGVLEFAGRSRVEIANSRGLAGPDKSFTAELWYRPPADPAPEPLFVMGDAAMGGGHPDLPTGTIRGWYLQYLRQPETPDRCSLRLFSPDSAQRAVGAIVSLPGLRDRWHHIAVCNEIVDGGGRRQAIFLDGKRLVDRTWPPATPHESLTNLFLGCSPYSTPPHRFTGQVRAFRLSGTFRYVESSFTPEQDFRRDEDTLVLLDFSSVPSTTLADLSGNGHEGKWFEASRTGEQNGFSSSSTTRSPPPATASPPAPVAEKTRHAAPAADELQQRLALVRNVFQEELAGADAPAQKLALATRLAEQATQEADTVTRFAMLSQARQLALDGLDWETAKSIIGQLDQQYEIEGWSMKAEAFRALAAATKTDDGRRAAIDTAMGLADEFSENDRHDLAEDVLDVASTMSRRLRDANVIRTIREKTRIVSEARKLWEVARSARETLATTPDDADANLELGKYLAFVKDSWDDALPHLQKGADPVLAQLAQQDLAEPNDPQRQVELAEGWSKWGDAASGGDQLEAWRRGQHWYVRAVPRLSGLTKTQVSKQLEELSERIAPSVPFQGLRLAWLETDVGLVRSFEAHQGPVSALAVSSSGKFLVTVSDDGTAKVWDLASGRALRELQLPPQQSKFRLQAVALSPDDKFVVAGGHSDSILVWNLETGAPTGQIKTRRLTDLAIAPDGRRLMWGMYPSGGSNGPTPTVGIWDIKAGRPAGQISCRGNVRTVDIAPNSRLGVTGDTTKIVQIWDLATGNPIRSMEGHAAEIFDVAFSPDGRKVASSTYDDVRIWDARTGKQLHVIPYPNGSHRLSFSPDSRRLACSGWMETVVLWDVASGEQLMRFRANTGGSPQHMKTVAYLPDPRGLVGGSGSGKIYIWKLPD